MNSSTYSRVLFKQTNQVLYYPGELPDIHLCQVESARDKIQEHASSREQSHLIILNTEIYQNKAFLPKQVMFELGNKVTLTVTSVTNVYFLFPTDFAEITCTSRTFTKILQVLLSDLSFPNFAKQRNEIENMLDFHMIVNEDLPCIFW